MAEKVMRLELPEGFQTMSPEEQESVMVDLLARAMVLVWTGKAEKVLLPKEFNSWQLPRLPEEGEE